MQPSNNNGLPPRPVMSGFTSSVGPSPLLARLQSFLPQLKAANEQLEQDIKVHGKEKYSIEQTPAQLEAAAKQNNNKLIKLDLSLGVLEEKSADNLTTGELNEDNIVIPKQGDKKTDDFDMKYRGDNDEEDNDDDAGKITPRERGLIKIHDETATTDKIDEEEFVQLGRDIEQEQDFAFATQMLNPFKNMSNTMGIEDKEEDQEQEQKEDGDKEEQGEGEDSQQETMIDATLLQDIISPADAVALLKNQYGYEAMNDVSVTMDLNEHVQLEHDNKNTMNDDEEEEAPKKVLIEEYTEPTNQ